MSEQPSSRKQTGQHPPIRTYADTYITKTMIKEFLAALSETKPNRNSLWAYQNALRIFSRDFPQERSFGRESYQNWCEELLATEYDIITVNHIITVVNELLNYHGLRQYQIKRFTDGQDKAIPELTRSEYLELLQAAKAAGMEREYLMAKMLATTGISVYDLISLRVEDIRNAGQGKQSIPFPTCLRKELLEYAARSNLETGAVFRTGLGEAPCRSVINVWLWKLGDTAKLSREKVTPRNLQNLFYAMKTDVESTVSLLIDHEMDRLAESEERTVGWNY